MKKTARVIIILLVLAIAISTSYCTASTVSVNQTKTTENVVVASKWQEVKKKKEPEVIPEDKIATIASFGDTLCHTSVYNSAQHGNTYDFSPIIEYVKPYLEKSTITVGNLESSLAGPERGYSGYPCFNCPEQLAQNLKDAGVDLMTTANNHCLDKGFDGLSRTLDYLDSVGIKHTGTSRSQEEQAEILYQDLNGIKTAFLAFTYGTNGIRTPSGKEFSVNYIDDDFILGKLQVAKKGNPDLIVVSMHWGNEYETVENHEQDRLAELLIKNGVDIILGCHPHVLQPMKMLNVTTDDGEKREGLVIFSQGNFFSGQTKENTRNTALFKIKVRQDGETGKVRVEKAKYTPLYCFNNGNYTDKYKLLDLEEIVRSYEAGEGVWNQAMYNLAIAERDRCYRLIGSEIDNTNK